MLWGFIDVWLIFSVMRLVSMLQCTGPACWSSRYSWPSYLQLASAAAFQRGFTCYFRCLRSTSRFVTVCHSYFGIMITELTIALQRVTICAASTKPHHRLNNAWPGLLPVDARYVVCQVSAGLLYVSITRVEVDDSVSHGSPHAADRFMSKHNLLGQSMEVRFSDTRAVLLMCFQWLEYTIKAGIFA